MPLNQILQSDYTAHPAYYQLSLEIEHDIPVDDSVRLLSSFVEEMDLSELYATYQRIQKSETDPREMLKIMIYANMNHIYSSRAIERACGRDINFMYLLNGKPAPDHAKVARFRSIHFAACAKELMAKMTGLLKELGEISGTAVFIDGTKIEANANKYTFVWKKTVIKCQDKVLDSLADVLKSCEEQYGIRVAHGTEISLHTLKRLRKKLYRLKKEEGVEFVHGSGKRKPPLQRSIEQVESLIDRLKGYIQKIHVCGERNSFSKTDPDATFMRMKEDYMKNGQLKPGYNVQHAVDSEYIVWSDISWHPTDTRTLIPFLTGMEEHLGFKYRDITADSGYESEENYAFLEKNGQIPYIKPVNYEISKTRKYKSDIGRKENMEYHEDEDCYICRNQKKLEPAGERTSKTESGYSRTITIYECNDCKGCPYKTQCIHGNNCKTPMEERTKKLNVSKQLEKYRKADLDNILSDYGTQLRMNRSIQAEGSFADVKSDMEFRRYLCRGNSNVLTESILLAMAHNMNKLHAKIQSGRTGSHLFELKSEA